MQTRIEPKKEPLAYRINEFCALLGISRTTLYALVKDGKIRMVKIGGRSLVPASEGQRLLQEAA
jgi:excisionase family DNA binding protein